MMSIVFDRIDEPLMSNLISSQRGRNPQDMFALFGGMLCVFTLAYVITATADAYWVGASVWLVVAYAAQCMLILLSMAWAIRRRAGQRAVLMLAYALIATHFVVFASARLLWTAPPVDLEQAILVSRVFFYFASAAVGYWLACALYFKSRVEVLYASVLPGAALLAGAWWVLRDAIDASQVVTSFGMTIAFVLSGLALNALSRIESVQRCFSNRTWNPMANELVQAKRVHESMFPEPIDTEQFRFGYAYRPMRQIGGDFIHTYPEQPGESADRSFYLTLIDVTGHGITSALTVNRLHTELQQYFATAKSPCPSDALGYLNDYVRLTMADHGLFATAMCVKVDCNSGTVTLANAGHPLCYYRKADGLQVIDAEGPMLGVFPPQAFDATPVSFAYEPGDQLIMVTDGAIEARSTADEMLGTERLHRIIERSCRQSASPVNERGDASLLQRKISGRLLDRSDVRKPVGLIQQVLRQRLNAHPCALADEIMLSIDDFVKQDCQDDILIATIELLKGMPSQAGDAIAAADRECETVLAGTTD